MVASKQPPRDIEHHERIEYDWLGQAQHRAYLIVLSGLCLIMPPAVFAEGVAWETSEAQGWRTNRAGSDLSEDCWRDRGQTVALPPNMGCVEGFSTILELVNYQFFQDWNVSSPGVDLPAVTSVTPDVEYYTAVVFSQSGVDSQGQTQITVDFHLRGPAGQEVIQPVLDAECWNGKPAPIGRELGLCVQYIKLPVDRLADEGDYTIEATVKDYFKKVQVKLKKLVTFHR